jgi:hypothetical protein
VCAVSTQQLLVSLSFDSSLTNQLQHEHLGAYGLGQPSKGPSNSFEPASDRPFNLVETVLLHKVETSDDHVVLIREAARQSPDSARDDSLAEKI